MSYPIAVTQSVWRRLKAQGKFPFGVRERGEAAGVTTGCNVDPNTSTEIKPYGDKKLGEELGISHPILGEQAGASATALVL